MQVYGLMGYPLGHSFSKQYFTQKFQTEHITNAQFELYPLPNITELPNLLLQTPQLKGLAVTIPYKEAIMPYLTHINEAAQQIGAVNCITINKGILTGHNTDVIGFEQSLQPLLQPHHQKALVLGTGGAAKAVQYVLQKLGIEYSIVSRTKGEGKHGITYSDVNQTILQQHLLIINCTPLGMHPNVTTLPAIPYEYLTPQHFLYDLVYQPATTAFLQQGMLKNTLVKNGYEMLAIQAEANWQIWNSI